MAMWLLIVVVALLWCTMGLMAYRRRSDLRNGPLIVAALFVLLSVDTLARMEGELLEQSIALALWLTLAAYMLFLATVKPDKDRPEETPPGSD